MEAAQAAPPPPMTAAPHPSSSSSRSFDEVTTPVATTATSSVKSHEASLGGSRNSAAQVSVDIRPVFDMCYDVEGAASLRPPRVPVTSTTCVASIAEQNRGTETSEVGQLGAEKSLGRDGGMNRVRGQDDALGGANSSARKHQRHRQSPHQTCGRDSVHSSYPLSLMPHAIERKVTVSERNRTRAELGSRRTSSLAAPEERTREDEGGQLTPVTVTEGMVTPSAELDATPLVSRPPRDTNRNRGVRGGATSSGASEHLSELDGSGEHGEGRASPEHATTWEAFLASISVGHGDDEPSGGAGSTSESSSPGEFQSQRTSWAPHRRTPASGDKNSYLAKGYMRRFKSKSKISSADERSHSGGGHHNRVGSGSRSRSRSRSAEGDAGAKRVQDDGPKDTMYGGDHEGGSPDRDRGGQDDGDADIDDGATGAQGEAAGEGESGGQGEGERDADRSRSEHEPERLQDADHKHDADADDDGDADDDDAATTSTLAHAASSTTDLVSSSSLPRMVNETDKRIAVDLYVGRSQSLSAVGSFTADNVRQRRQAGITKFNGDPKAGVAYLIEHKLIPDSAKGICDFVTSTRGLSKRRLGEYFGMDSQQSQEVLSLFLKTLNFQGVVLDDALRSMVLKFRLPGEAQIMDRIVQRFAERYHEENPTIFSSAETAWVMAFGLMILNTDMYNRNVRESDKMSEAQFVRNYRGIDQGKDLPQELLIGMYRRIEAAEIRMDEEDMYEAEEIALIAPTKCGWLRKKRKGMVSTWKRHWFVLNDGVLYYFLSPQHQDEAPRCIIPLEKIKPPDKSPDLSFTLTQEEGFVKSVKMRDDGLMQQAQHRSFILRADSPAEQDAWVAAIRTEVMAAQMDLDARRSLSETPATSAGATPVMTPSSASRRSGHDFVAGRLNRKRAGTLEAISPEDDAVPLVRGWARTQGGVKLESLSSNPNHANTLTEERRYLALFRSVGPDEDDVIFFFGGAAMCDRMVKNNVRTYHGSVNLKDFTGPHERQEDGKMGGKRAIVLHRAAANGPKEFVFAPEDHRSFSVWWNHVKKSCTEKSKGGASSSTPMTSNIGETAFPSVNTVDSGGEISFPTIGSINLAEHMGLDDNVFVAVEPPLGDSNASLQNKTVELSPGASGSGDAYERMESSDTQPSGGFNGAQDVTRALLMPSAETEADNHVEHNATTPRSPRSPAPELVLANPGDRDAGQTRK